MISVIERLDKSFEEIKDTIEENCKHLFLSGLTMKLRNLPQHWSLIPLLKELKGKH